MKKTLHILPIAALLTTGVIAMTACSSKEKTDAEKNLVLSASDTTGLADFQEWKAQNERKDANTYYMNNTAAPVNTKPAVARESCACNNNACCHRQEKRLE